VKVENDTIAEIEPSSSPGSPLLITIYTPLFENREVRFV